MIGRYVAGDIVVLREDIGDIGEWSSLGGINIGDLKDYGGCRFRINHAIRGIEPQRYHATHLGDGADDKRVWSLTDEMIEGRYMVGDIVVLREDIDEWSSLGGVDTGDLKDYGGCRFRITGPPAGAPGRYRATHIGDDDDDERIWFLTDEMIERKHRPERKRKPERRIDWVLENFG